MAAALLGEGLETVGLGGIEEDVFLADGGEEAEGLAVVDEGRDEVGAVGGGSGGGTFALGLLGDGAGLLEGEGVGIDDGAREVVAEAFGEGDGAADGGEEGREGGGPFAAAMAPEEVFHVIDVEEDALAVVVLGIEEEVRGDDAGGVGPGLDAEEADRLGTADGGVRGGELGGEDGGGEVEGACGEVGVARGLEDGEGAGAIGVFSEEEEAGGPVVADGGEGAPGGVRRDGETVADEGVGEGTGELGAQVADVAPLEVNQEREEEGRDEEDAGDEATLAVEGEGKGGAVGLGHGGFLSGGKELDDEGGEEDDEDAREDEEQQGEGHVDDGLLGTFLRATAGLAADELGGGAEVVGDGGAHLDGLREGGEDGGGLGRADALGDVVEGGGEGGAEGDLVAQEDEFLADGAGLGDLGDGDDAREEVAAGLADQAHDVEGAGELADEGAGALGGEVAQRALGPLPEHDGEEGDRQGDEARMDAQERQDDKQDEGGEDGEDPAGDKDLRSRGAAEEGAAGLPDEGLEFGETRIEGGIAATATLDHAGEAGEELVEEGAVGGVTDDAGAGAEQGADGDVGHERGGERAGKEPEKEVGVHTRTSTILRIQT